MSDRGFAETWLKAARATLAGEIGTIPAELESALLATREAIRLVLQFDPTPRDPGATR